MQRYRDTEIQGYIDTWIQRYRDTEIQGCRYTGIQTYRDTKIQGYIDRWIQRNRDTEIQRDTGYRRIKNIEGYSDTGDRGIMEYSNT